MDKPPEEIIEDLVNLNADEWNLQVSKALGGIPIENIKSFILARELKLDKTKIKFDIDFKTIEDKEKQRAIDSKGSIIGDLQNKYVVSLSDTDITINSIACTGKIIIGFDFSDSSLEDSYFCHCSFYNCSFKNTNLLNSVISSCTFNSCDFIETDLTAVTISRSKFIECKMNRSILEYSNISDSVYIETDLSDSNFVQSKILYTGFNSCNLESINFKDADLIQISLSNVNLKKVKFKRTKFLDSIMLKVDLTGCTFDNLLASAITHSLCEMDDRIRHIFDMDIEYLSPSLFEWEVETEKNEDEDDVNPEEWND